MKAYAALSATIALLVTPVSAQDDTGAAARGATCSVIEDSLQRLTCFDKAFPKATDVEVGASPAPAESAAPSGDASTGAWTVEVGKSAIDDSPSVVATLLPNEGQAGGLYRSGLLVRCKENRTEVIIATDDIEFGTDMGTLTYRFDSAPAVTTKWAMADNHSAMGLWSGTVSIPFLRTMSTARKLAVRTMLQKQIDMTFDLTGIGPVVDQVAKACNWPVAK